VPLYPFIFFFLPFLIVFCDLHFFLLPFCPN
jgi:hypothetical protein